MNNMITGRTRWYSLNVKELLNYKDLFYFLAWRDIKVRYKQTAIGVLWAFFVPFITMVVFTVFFGTFAGIDSAGIPYPIFVYTGLLFWTFFSQALTNASNSLVSSQDIIKKIYFPKLLLPAASIFVTLFDFFIASLILLGLMIWYQMLPSLESMVVIPVLIVLTYLLALGLGLLLAAINVKYRDVRYVIPFFVQTLLFLTPVIYPVSIASDYQWILLLNPMAAIIETARAVLLQSGQIPWQALALAGLFCLALLVVGWVYFKKTERYFADII